ncbi:MAG: GxxExxY protein [Planctomycetes bacterium]|nr:GxxExxY protein [Planctomycetota bacterium]
MSFEAEKSMDKIIYREEGYQLQGAFFEVYREMGFGFAESVYQECLEIELRGRRIPFVSQVGLKLSYKGSELKQTYIPDLLCFDKIVVELKALNPRYSR